MPNNSLTGFRRCGHRLKALDQLPIWSPENDFSVLVYPYSPDLQNGNSLRGRLHFRRQTGHGTKSPCSVSSSSLRSCTSSCGFGSSSSNIGTKHSWHRMWPQSSARIGSLISTRLSKHTGHARVGVAGGREIGVECSAGASAGGSPAASTCSVSSRSSCCRATSSAGGATASGGGAIGSAAWGICGGSCAGPAGSSFRIRISIRCLKAMALHGRFCSRSGQAWRMRMARRARSRSV